MVPRDMSPRKRMEKMTQSSNTSTSDHVKRAYQSTPENPDLHERVKSSDRASMSDGSRSGNDNPMLRLMEMTMKEKLDTANKLEQANQKIQELTEERDSLRKILIDLTTKLEQALRENEKLTNQLKDARLDGKPPLQRGDSSSKSPEEIESTRKVMREWMLKKIGEK